MVTGRRLRYGRALAIIQAEEYLSAVSNTFLQYQLLVIVSNSSFIFRHFLIILTKPKDISFPNNMFLPRYSTYT